jgi:hypothetical protein
MVKVTCFCCDKIKDESLCLCVVVSGIHILCHDCFIEHWSEKLKNKFVEKLKKKQKLGEKDATQKS